VQRREFLGSIAAATCLSATRGVAADKPFRVGIASLVNGRTAPQFVAFEQRLKELDAAAGQVLAIDFVDLNGDAGRYPAAMQELVSRGVDVLLAPGQEIALKAAQAAGGTIPIVMVAIDYDPVARGYVQNLARPGGNITGVYLDTIEFAAKRAEVLKETVPNLTRIVVFWDAIARDSFTATVPAIAALGLKVLPVEFHDPPYDYEAALATAAPEPGDALLCMMSPYFFHDREELDRLAIRNRLPSMCGAVDSGGLIAYAPSLNSIFRSAADYVDKIRKGAKPAELPIEQPTRFKLVVNLKIAKQIGLTIPPLILARADEVIE